MKHIIFILLSLSFLIASFFNNEHYIKMEQKYGSAATLRLKQLDALMMELQDKSELEKLERVNGFFNNIHFVSDEKLWGKSDYWASRMESIGKNAGDCEDYVIAKFFTLIDLGIPQEKLYFTYVKENVIYKQAHMVLTYYPTKKSIPLVLDNINKKIVEATMRKDLQPVYSFNGESLFMAKQEGLGKAIPGDNKKWKELSEKMKKDF